MGRKEGIVAGEEEPYVTAAVAPPGWWAPVVGLRWGGFEEDDAAVDVWGRVNSSNRSASLGWCMWRYVAEESLLWGFRSVSDSVVKR